MKELFNTLTEKYGGILDIGSEEKVSPDCVLPPELLGLDLFRFNIQRMASAKLSNQASLCPGIEDIYTYYVKNRSINAWAIRDKYSGHEFIGLAFGASLELQAYFALLLSSRDFLTNIGNSHYEHLTLSQIKPDLHNQSGIYFGKHYPKCKIRRNLVAALWMVAMDFLCYHEIGHHMRGHLFLLEEEFGCDSIPEYWDSHIELYKKNLELNQLIEIDADRYATIVLGETAGYTHSVAGIDKETISVDELRYIACSVLFHIFDELSIDNSLSSLTTHPHPAIRRLSLLYSILEVSAKNQSQFSAAMMNYSPLTNLLELAFTTLSKYPKYRKHTRLQQVSESMLFLRRNLDDLVDSRLNALIEKRNISKSK